MNPLKEIAHGLSAFGAAAGATIGVVNANISAALREQAELEEMHQRLLVIDPRLTPQMVQTLAHRADLLPDLTFCRLLHEIALQGRTQWVLEQVNEPWSSHQFRERLQLSRFWFMDEMYTLEGRLKGGDARRFAAFEEKIRQTKEQADG